MKFPKVKLGEIVEFPMEYAPRNKVGDLIVFTGPWEGAGPYQLIGRRYDRNMWVAHKPTRKGYFQGLLYRAGQRCLGVRQWVGYCLYVYGLMDIEEGEMLNFRRVRLRWPDREWPRKRGLIP